MDILKINDISFSYENKKVLDNISFTITKGEIFCILGPNGCGKSTLLDCILGFNKLDSGEILLHEKDIQKYKAIEFAKEIAYVPQGHTKSFPYKVKDIVLMGRTHSFKFCAQPTEIDKNEAIEALKEIGIEDLKDRVYTSLSGGELQLVLLARALYQNSKIIVMDEPTSHLDFYYESKVLNIISKLVKNSKITVIMATHFLNHPFYFESHGIKTNIGIMKDKKIIFKGKASEGLTEENLNKIYKINTKINELEYEDKIYKQVITLS